MKIFSDACEYALRATLWLSLRPAQPYKVREIAEGTQASPGYLVKVLQRLSRAGILSAQRGSQGGFKLERLPTELTALDVINAVDPIERIQRCPLQIESHEARLCQLHQQLDDAMGLIERCFGAVTIAALIDDPAAPQICDALERPDHPRT